MSGNHNADCHTLFRILNVAGIKYRDNLYRNQTAIIRVKWHEKGAVVEKEVRQGCSLFPTLFNLYTEQAVKEGKERFRDGIKA